MQTCHLLLVYQRRSDDRTTLNVAVHPHITEHHSATMTACGTISVSEEPDRHAVAVRKSSHRHLLQGNM